MFMGDFNSLKIEFNNNKIYLKSIGLHSGFHAIVVKIIDFVSNERFVCVDKELSFECNFYCNYFRHK